MVEGWAVSTRAVALDASGDAVYFSSLGSSDASVFGGVLSYSLASGVVTVALRDAPRVLGLAFDADAAAGGCVDATGWLYYSDAQRRLVAQSIGAKSLLSLSLSLSRAGLPKRI